MLYQIQQSPLSQPMPDAFSDESLMCRYRDGDATAFDTLYHRHKGGIFRYLLRQCGNRATAEELAQEIWLNLIRAHERYTDSAKFTTYLYTLAHNRLIDHYRKHQRQLVDCFTDNDATDIENIAALSRYEPEQEMNRDSQQTQILTAIANLPAPQREAFLLREESNLPLQDIATVTGVGVETAKSRLRYAVASLRKALRGAL